jgi:LacI family transcriptional regulator
MVNMRDVARRARVSISTVSNAVNHPERVSGDSLRRVQHAIEELGFVRNEAARQLRHGHSRTVGFIMLDGKNPFFMDVARGAEDRAAESGLVLTFGDSARDVNRELSYLDLFEQQRVQGVLISPYGEVTDKLTQLADRGIASVLLNRRSTDRKFSSVSVDDVAGGRLAIEHLIARGRRRIAFVGSEETSQFVDRLAGIRQVLEVNPDVRLELIEIAAPHVVDGRVAGAEIAAREIDAMPDAIFASNDVVAMGILQGLAMGPRPVLVPDDIALIGYDDIDFAETAVVPLSSVKHPAALIGSTAVDLLLAESQNPQLPKQQIVYRPEIVERASTGPLRRNGQMQRVGDRDPLHLPSR